jgi:hypothetical protein
VTTATLPCITVGMGTSGFPCCGNGNLAISLAVVSVGIFLQHLSLGHTLMPMATPLLYYTALSFSFQMQCHMYDRVTAPGEVNPDFALLVKVKDEVSARVLALAITRASTHTLKSHALTPNCRH